MTRPCSGVNPIEVSTATPPRIAEMDAPLPRWQTIWSTSSYGRSSSSATRSDTYLWLVPWKPYLRIEYVFARRASIAYVYASAGRVEKNAVSKIATCGTSGSAAIAASMPAIPGGLSSGASGDNSTSFAITSSSIRTAWRNASPPWTARCPTATTSASGGPYIPNALTTSSSACRWLATIRSMRCVSPSVVWSRLESGSPIFCTRPVASRDSSSTSMSWYLIELEPQIRTRIGVGTVLLRVRLLGERRRRPGRYGLGLDCRDRDDVVDRRTARQIVDGLVEPLHDGADGDGVGRALDRLVRVVAGVEVGEHEHGRLAGHQRMGQLGLGDGFVHRRVELDRSLDEQLRGALLDEPGRLADLLHVGARAGRTRAVREHRDARLDPERDGGLGGRDRDVRELLVEGPIQFDAAMD